MAGQLNGEALHKYDHNQSIVVDNEKPCCSKSLLKETKNVQFVPCENSFGNKEISNNCSTGSYLPEQSNFGLAFSDTVLAIIPKLPELNEEPYQEVNDDENDAKFWNEITRKEPNVNLFVNSSPASGSLFPNESIFNSENIEEELDYDENNNEIKWSERCEKKLLESASYLFHEDRRHQLANTVNLLPRGREYAVFNVFHDFARLFGYNRKKRKHVAFPSDVLQQYEEKGDVAGKDRFVPTAKTPYKGIAASSKKRKLSAVYSSWTVKEADFVPKIERIDDYNKCEYYCERKCLACDCLTGSDKPDLTNVMEGYLSDLNVASLFIQGHATRTFESAMNTLEFVKLKNINTSNVNHSLVYQRSYSKHKLGILSSGVWIFGYCIRLMIQQAMDPRVDNSTRLPSETCLKNILEQFAAMCLGMMESIKTVLQHSHNFYNFCKECIRLLKVLQIHVGFPADLKLKRPLRRGAGLELNRKLSKKDIQKQQAVTVMIARTRSVVENEGDGDEGLEWKSFTELNGYDKVGCLRHLLNITSEGINLVQTQLRFLLDDIVDSVRDIAEADLLFILADMHDRVRFLENVGSRHTKAEMQQISRLMADFCKDFQSFADFGQHILTRFVEISDMIHVTYEFLLRGLRQDALSEMLPANAYKKQLTIFGLCGHGVKSRKRIVEKHQPKYQALDFFRVYYSEATNKNAQIYGSKFHFNLIWSKEKLGPVFPIGMNWGEIEGSPQISFEEYVDPETDDEVQIELKPILVGSPAASPRGSITSDDIGVETFSSSLEVPMSRS